MVRIEVFTKPGCGGCERLKEDISQTDLSEITVYKTIKGKEGYENLSYIKRKGFDNIPVIRVFTPLREDFLVGYHPIEQIREKIDAVIEVHNRWK